MLQQVYTTEGIDARILRLLKERKHIALKDCLVGNCRHLRSGMIYPNRLVIAQFAKVLHQRAVSATEVDNLRPLKLWQEDLMKIAIYGSYGELLWAVAKARLIIFVE